MKSETTMPATPDLEPTLRFLEELSQNNDKAWFDRHRPVYAAARDAFRQLVDRLIDELGETDDLAGLSADDCIARIYRDIRFSKDKSPYKTNMGALVAPGGWRGGGLGYYISLQPRAQSMVAGGLYAPAPEQLERFRQAIDADATTFKRLTSDAAFVEAFGAVAGERLKTAPKGYDRAHPEIALLQLKQITAVHRFADREVLAPDFTRRVARICRSMKPFLDYLERATARG